MQVVKNSSQSRGSGKIAVQGRICAAWRKPSAKINHNARRDIFRLGPIGKRSENSYFPAFSAEKSMVAVSGKSYRPTRKAGCRATSRQHMGRFSP
jgi:hypothetical protein